MGDRTGAAGLPSRPMGETESNGASPRVCVVVSAYSRSITGKLLDGAVSCFGERHPGAPAPEVVWAPGSFELVPIAAAAVETGRFDAVVTLGCVIRGETDHDRYISQAIASALADLNLGSDVPVSFGVITANNRDQAEARAGGAKGNKGEEAMVAALEAWGACRALALGEPAGDSSVDTDKGRG